MKPKTRAEKIRFLKELQSGVRDFTELADPKLILFKTTLQAPEMYVRTDTNKNYSIAEIKKLQKRNPRYEFLIIHREIIFKR
jgi:hypothetical protein